MTSPNLTLSRCGRWLLTPIGQLPAQHGKGGIRADKREGDGATPVGCLPVRRVFYRPDRVARPETQLPVVEITPKMGWCDDPEHEAYNRLIPLPHPARHEQMWREDGLYDLVVELGYNDDPPKVGKGSAIFLHCAAEDWRGTEGCVALQKSDLQRLLPSLTPATTLTVQPALPDLDRLFTEGASRLAHIRQVIATAHKLEAKLPFGGKLVEAAWYHDIGYSDRHASTGFHPVDSMVLARADGLSADVQQAVLHHSGSYGVATRSRPDLMAHYPDGCQLMATQLNRAVTFCDLRSGPNGQAFTLAERLADIRQRHGDKPAALQKLEAYQHKFEQIEAEFGHLLT